MDTDFENRRNLLLVEGRWSELVEVLEEENKHRCDVERTEILEELGSIYLEHLSNVELAYRSWEDMFSIPGSENLVESYCVQILKKFPNFEPALLRLEPILREGDEDSLKRLASFYLDLADGQKSELVTHIGYQKKAADIFEGFGDFESAYLILVSSLNGESLGSLYEELEKLARLNQSLPVFVEHINKELLGLSLESAAPYFKKLGLIAIEAGKFEEATANLRNAAKAFPHDPEIPLALGQLYQEQGDWDASIKDVELRLQTAVDFRHKKELNTQLEAIYEKAARDSPGQKGAQYFHQQGLLFEQKNDYAQARQSWTNALKKDPRHIGALNKRIHRSAVSDTPDFLLDLLGRLLGRLDQESTALGPEVLLQRLTEYGALLSAHLSNTSMHTLSEVYRRMYELDVQNFDTAFRYGLALFEEKEFEKALRVLKRVIESRGAHENVGVLFRTAASAAYHQNEFNLSWEWVQHAVHLLPQDLQSWLMYRNLSDDQQKLSQRIDSREKIIALTTDANEREKIQIELGDIWMEANRPDFAMEAYKKVLSYHPDSVSVLRKQLVILQKLEKWEPLVHVIETLSELEQDRQKKSNFLYTIAIIYRDQIQNIEGAVHYFNLALDTNPGFLKAFEAIDRILTDRKLWRGLERAYLKMLARLDAAELGGSGKDGDLKFLLFKNLGELYRTRLSDTPKAITAFETAGSFRPGNQEITLILAQLYSKSGGSGGIDKLRAAIAQNPLHLQTIEALFNSYLNEQNYDAAFCVANALKSWGSTHSESHDFLARYISPNLKMASGNFYPELLERMYHEKLDRSVSSFMAVISYALRGPYGKTVKDWGVSEKEEVDQTRPHDRFTKMFSYFSSLVGPQPFTKLYLRKDHALGLRNMFCDPPSILVGSNFSAPHNVHMTAFQCGKMLAGLRPELYLAHAGFSVEHLNLFFLSSLEFALDRKPSAGKNGAAVFKCLKKLPKPIKMQLQAMGRALEKMPPPDLSLWTDLADFSSSRFGLLVSGDVETSIQCLRDSDHVIGSRPLIEKNEDLLSFSISEHYFQVRRELGLSLF